jgi:PhnB protein
MKKIIPEIYVDNCKEALEFYKGILGGEIKNFQMADDKEMFKGFEGKVVHSELHINEDCIIYLYDIFKGKKETGSNHVLLELDSEEEINQVFEGLSKDGNVQFDLQKTFWGAYHAVVIDRYGNKWGLNYTVK